MLNDTFEPPYRSFAKNWRHINTQTHKITQKGKQNQTLKRFYKKK